MKKFINELVKGMQMVFCTYSSDVRNVARYC